jgi:hypothetical protein
LCNSCDVLALNQSAAMEQSSEQSTDENWDLFRSKTSFSRRNIEIKNDLKRIPCRYGHGCTHIQDPLHLERFTHPPIPIVDGLILFDFSLDLLLAEAIVTNFMCYECGMMFMTLPDLQVARTLDIDFNLLFFSFICKGRQHGQIIH